jgi:hypothetical protein
VAVSFEHGDLLSECQNFEAISLRLRKNTRIPTMNVLSILGAAMPFLQRIATRILWELPPAVAEDENHATNKESSSKRQHKATDFLFAASVAGATPKSVVTSMAGFAWAGSATTAQQKATVF